MRCPEHQWINTKDAIRWETVFVGGERERGREGKGREGKGENNLKFKYKWTLITPEPYTRKQQAAHKSPVLSNSIELFITI